jgi:hypothetical protein
LDVDRFVVDEERQVAVRTSREHRYPSEILRVLAAPGKALLGLLSIS